MVALYLSSERRLDPRLAGDLKSSQPITGGWWTPPGAALSHLVNTETLLCSKMVDAERLKTREFKTLLSGPEYYDRTKWREIATKLPVPGKRLLSRTLRTSRIYFGLL